MKIEFISTSVRLSVNDGAIFEIAFANTKIRGLSSFTIYNEGIGVYKSETWKNQSKTAAIELLKQYFKFKAS